jgi:hypothetical protein
LLLSGSFATVLDFCSQSHNTSHLFGSHTPSLTLCGSPSVAGPPCSSSTDHGVAGMSYRPNSFFCRDDSLFLGWPEPLATEALVPPFPGGSSHIICTFICSTAPFSRRSSRDPRKLETYSSALVVGPSLCTETQRWWN